MANGAIEHGHHFRSLILESHVSSVPSKKNFHLEKHLPWEKKPSRLVSDVAFDQEAVNQGKGQLQLFASSSPTKPLIMFPIP